MPRVSQLPLASSVGTVYVIEGGVSKRIVLGTMALQAAASVAITGGTVAGISSLGVTGGSITYAAASLNDGAILINAGNATGSGRGIRFRNTSGNGESWFGTVQNASSREEFVWQGYNGSDYAEWMRLYNSNLGVGTSAPATRLEVYEASTGALITVNSGTNGSSRGVVWRNGTTSNNFGSILADYTSGVFTFDAGAAVYAGQVAFRCGTAGEMARLSSAGLALAAGISIAGAAIIGTRKTGWAAATGTPTRTTFATGSVTTAQLAERVKALIDDLISHGLIGA